MKTTIQVSDARIANLFCSAVYSAIRYWVDSFDWTNGSLPRPEGCDNMSFCEIAPLTGGHWTITSGSEAGETPRTDTLDRAAVERGLEIMARDYPRHFGDLIGENDDAITADVFVQCCIFGELVYG